MPWRRPIVPRPPGRSIVGAGALHGRVRDGNGWDRPAPATRATGCTLCIGLHRVCGACARTKSGACAHEDVEDLNFADKRVDGHVPQVKAIGKKKALGR